MPSNANTLLRVLKNKDRHFKLNFLHWFCGESSYYFGSLFEAKGFLYVSSVAHWWRKPPHLPHSSLSSFLPLFSPALLFSAVTLHWRHQVSLKQEGVSNRDHKLPWQPPSSGLRLYPQLQITHTHDKSSAGLRLNPQDRNLSQGWGCTCEYRSHTPPWQQSSTGVRLHPSVQITLPRGGFLQGWGCTCNYRSYTHTHDNNLP